MRPPAYLAAVAMVIGLALIGSPAQAQTPPTPTGTPPPATPPPGLRDPRTGDVVWAFAQEFPFFDDRAALALSSVMAPVIGSTQGVPVLPADANLRRAVVGEKDVVLLIEAAGLRGRPGSAPPPPLKVIGSCRIWIAPAPAGITADAPLAKSADGIGTAFVQAMRELLGVTLAPCTTTTNVAEAQILVWTQGGPVPANPMRQASTLIAANFAPPPQAGGVGGGPLPAKTGNAGIEAGGLASGVILVLLVPVASAVLAARARVRRRG